MNMFLRQTKILDLIQDKGQLTVEELCAALDVSPATVRRDLKELERRQLLMRFHGGAAQHDLVNDKDHVQTLGERLKQNLSEKNHIAAVAANLVEDGEVIGLTGGSTNILLAKQLRVKKNVTVITNCVSVAAEFSNCKEIDVNLTGGKLRFNSMCLVGPLAEMSLSRIRIHKVFMGVEAIHQEYGVTTHNFSEAQIDRCMADCANETIVICDDSKFGKTLFSEVIPITGIQHIITNRAINHALLEPFKSHQIKITLA